MLPSPSSSTTGRCQWTLGIAAGLLIASGLFHVPIWFLSGDPWEGPVSWRKPILFGLSTGLTLWSMAWLYPRWQPGKLDLLLSGILAGSMLGEVGLIALQTWRNEASHFNHSTMPNAIIEVSMTILITTAFAVITWFARRSFQSLNATEDIRLAVRGGMVFLLLSCLIGFAILSHGYQQRTLGANPSIYGRAGVTKFPHGIAIHALQILPVACWCLSRAGISLLWRVRFTALGIHGFAILLMFSILQTLAGHSRFDVDRFSILLVIVALALPLALLPRWRRASASP